MTTDTLPRAAVGDVVADMVAEIESAEEIYRPSRYWTSLCEKNLAMLQAEGIENFKRTLAQNYFNWLVISPYDPQFQSAFKRWPLHWSLRPLTNRLQAFDKLWTIEAEKGKPLKWIHRFFYKTFVGLLWEYARVQDRSAACAQMQEPALGNPIHLWRGRRRISQDLANSILEYNFLLRHADQLRTGRRRIGELGAGYGRLAHVVVAQSQAPYFIFDIPPALYVSQWYLRQLFPDKKIFTFRRFTHFADVQAEIEASDLAFLTPNQLQYFPADFFDLFLTISTFPEMAVPQVENYLALMSRVSARWIYLKQWAEWYNPLDHSRLTKDQYRLPPEWELQTDEADTIMPLFFNQFWAKRANP